MKKNIDKMKSRMYDALESGDVDVVREVLEAGLDPNADVYGNRPLWLAAYNNHLECARLLLEAGSDPNIGESGSFSQPPLFGAVRQGYTEMVRLLLDHDAATHMRRNGYMEMESALADPGNGEIVRMLVAKGCSPDDIEIFTGKTPLQSAYKADVVEALLEAGADRNGCYPIHLAAERGQAAEIVGLIALGFDPSAKNEKGYTPLHLAANMEEADTCSILIDAGADLRARDAKGREPSGVAQGAAKAVLHAAEEREWLAAEAVAPQVSAGRRRI